MTPTKMSSGLYRFCDASKWQVDMDWAKASTRLDFGYAKSSQGKWLDPQWVANWSECDGLGFPLGAYHYYDTTITPGAQAAFFLETLSRYPTPLVPAIDLEMVRPAPRLVDILQFIGDIVEELQVLPIIYTGPAFILAYLQAAPELSQYPLWISHYSTDKRWPLAAPRVPLPWFAMDWWGWQFSADGNGQGKYYGAQSPSLDLNVAWSIPWMPGKEPG